MKATKASHIHMTFETAVTILLTTGITPKVFNAVVEEMSLLVKARFVRLIVFDARYDNMGDVLTYSRKGKEFSVNRKTRLAIYTIMEKIARDKRVDRLFEKVALDHNIV